MGLLGGAKRSEARPGSDALHAEDEMTVGVRPASRAAGLRERTRGKGSAPSSVLVMALIGYLGLEYLRPPLLQPLRLQMVFLVVFPILWLTSRERPWSGNLTLQLLFLIAGSLTLPFAHNYFVVYMNARFMYGFLVTALTTTWLLAYRGNFQRVVWAWVGIVCFQAFWAITHDGRGYGSFLGDENDLALACDMAFPFAILGLQCFRGAKRWVCGFAALLLLCGVVASFSRGGFLGLVAAAGYCLLAARHRVRNIAIGCTLAGVFYLAVPSGYRSEIGTIEDTSSGTAEARLFLWTAAARMWTDHPIFGVGPANAPFLLGRYQVEATEGAMFSGRQFQERDWSMTALHSVYLQLLSERGLVGVLLFGWMAVAFYAGLRRLRREAQRMRDGPPSLVADASMYALALEAAMAGYLVAAGFLSMLYFPYFWFFTALAVAHDRAIRREYGAHGSRRVPGSPGETRSLGPTPRCT